MFTTKSLSLWLLGLTLLVDVDQTASSSANKTIRLGYLVSYMPLAGAINVAIENAQNDGLLRGYHFRYAN